MTPAKGNNMPSVLRVLLVDTDIPADLRADLRVFESGQTASLRQAARRRAASALRAQFDLDEAEIAALLALAPRPGDQGGERAPRQAA
jgi:hypothetical protein